MKKIQYWKKQILDLIYPARCPICHEIVQPGYDMICENCVSLLPLNCGYQCKICGKPVEHAEELCHDCTESEHIFTKGMGIFYYDDIMRSSIHKFKYQGRREYGRFYGNAAWKYGQEQLKEWNPQVLVPVPVHISRKIQRGYNQAEVIAGVLAEQIGLPVATDVVIRKKRQRHKKICHQKNGSEIWNLHLQKVRARFFGSGFC